MVSLISSNWDHPGSRWDSGLFWDDALDGYLDLVTSEHRSRPNFIATLTALLQPIVGLQALVYTFPSLFDLDGAVGAQLDVVGQWVGVSRQLPIPLTGVYFSWGISGLGWGQGTWKGPFDPVSGLVSLPDDTYRTYIRAKIASNEWDGTIPGAYSAWDAAFAGTGHGILVQDYGNMHMLFALTGSLPDAVTQSLFVNGLLNIKPAGVRIDAFVTPSVPDAPYFGWGIDGPGIAGWGTGAWGVFAPGA